MYVAGRHCDSNVNVNDVPLTPHSSVLASLALTVLGRGDRETEGLGRE